MWNLWLGPIEFNPIFTGIPFIDGLLDIGWVAFEFIANSVSYLFVPIQYLITDSFIDASIISTILNLVGLNPMQVSIFGLVTILGIPIFIVAKIIKLIPLA